MATGIAAMMLRSVIEVSISMHDMEIEHRPYHRNCSCALHKLKSICSNACPPQQRNISFPKKKPPASKRLITIQARHGVIVSTPTQTKTKEDMGDGGEVYVSHQAPTLHTQIDT
ncbi:unnamed protein product [Prunus brigantina]